MWCYSAGLITIFSVDAATILYIERLVFVHGYNNRAVLSALVRKSIIPEMPRAASRALGSVF